MKRPRTTLTLAWFGLVMLAFFRTASPQTPAQLFISQVLVDVPAVGLMTIDGENFDNGGPARVTLGEFPEFLVLVQDPDSLVVDTLMAGLPAGEFALLVRTGAGTRRRATFDLTIPGSGGVVDWVDVLNKPLGFADDIDDEGVVVEVDPTVPDELIDGADWVDLIGIPAGFADGVDDVGDQVAQILDYGSSTSSSTSRSESDFKIAYGHVSVGGLATVTISNLPFTSAATFSVAGSYNLNDPNVVSRVQISRSSGSQIQITNAHPDTREINWIAMGI